MCNRRAASGGGQARNHGAALNVFETEPLPSNLPLWGVSKVIVTPHVAGSSPDEPGHWVEIIARDSAAVTEGSRDDLVNRVQ